MSLQLLSSCETLISDSSVMRELRSHTYDVMVIHALDYCAFGIAHMLRINATVWMSPAMMFESMAWHAGMPIESSYIPSGEWVCAHTVPFTAMHAVGEDMSLFKRVKNMLAGGAVMYMFDSFFASYYTSMFSV
jgi:hypothetical protein